MAKYYVNYSKEKFERELIQIRINNKLRSWKDITEEIEEESEYEVWEYIYMFPTYNKDLDIIIYSSIDRRTGRTREKGADAVRVIYRLREDGDVYYKRISKHLRINTLLGNLENTLADSNENCFDLYEHGWLMEVDAFA